jgi:hypothetical protein
MVTKSSFVTLLVLKSKSGVGKVMERIICKHVYNHLMQNKLIYQYQSGFLPKHSSVHQLIELHNTILNSLEKKELTRNNRGPRTDHWGIPADTDTYEDDESMFTTFLCLQ